MFRAWMFMLAATASGCHGMTEQDDGLAMSSSDVQWQPLSNEGEVCVTVQRGTSGQVEDATIWQKAVPHASSGSHEKLRVGTSPSDRSQRSLLRFDLSSVPADAHVLSAQLTLAQAHKGGPDSTVQVLRATAAWSEATVTWNSFADAFDPSPAASIPVTGKGSSGARTVELSGLVQAWVSGATPNHGVVLDDTHVTHTDFESSESPHASLRPAMAVCYVTCSDGIQNGDETGFDCGGSVCGPCNPDPGPPQGVPVEPEGTSMLIQVVGPGGTPIAGATVRLDGIEQTTDAQGNALFEGLSANTGVVQVTAPGFASSAFPVELEAGAHGGATTSLNPLGPPIEFSADTDATVVTEEVAVNIPAGSLKDENGLPVTGTAEIAFAPIDPMTDDIISSPGSFVGVSGATGETVELESGFMAEIALTQGGRPLQLAPGATATVTFTLPQDFAAVPGELIQAWWFDTEAGVWREDGLGLVEESPTEPGRLIWTIEVSHFTSWNCDRPWYTRSCADVRVIDQEGQPLPGRTITARGLSYGYRGTAITNAEGRACVPVMKDGFAQISVGSEWAPLAWQNITPTAIASCGGGECTSVTLTVPVPCGDPGTIQACAYTGRPGTEDVGACRAGYRVCDGFNWGACTGQVTPSAEICENDIDEDCDGQNNDGCPVCDEGGTQVCYTGPAGTEGLGVCKAGIQTCTKGTWGACTGQVIPAGSEICGNASDEDCDGKTSEGCTCSPGAEQSCYTGPVGTENIGVCKGGVRECFGTNTQSFWGACNGQVTPESEVCDGLDNDCTGETDDGNPGGGAECSTGQPGVCVQGTVTCSGGDLVCLSDTAASPEVCDALDNDCDGQSDEGNPGGGASCNTGIPGICAAGTMICQADGLACVQNQAPVAEDCNTSADDDCDGQANEDCNSGISYYTYSASNTASATQNTYNHQVTIPGGRTITIGTCGLPDVWANGDTYLRLYNPAGQQVAANDDACGNLSTFMMYSVPANAGGTYTIRSGCYSSRSCSGRVGYTF